MYFTNYCIICYVSSYFYIKLFHIEMKPSPDDTNLILKEIGSRIRERRKLLARNYEKFAEANDFNKVTISRIENGENFTMSSLIQVLRVLDISVEDFFKGIQ
jgi:hypothetical protein